MGGSGSYWNNQAAANQIITSEEYNLLQILNQ